MIGKQNRFAMMTLTGGYHHGKKWSEDKLG